MVILLISRSTHYESNARMPNFVTKVNKTIELSNISLYYYVFFNTLTFLLLLHKELAIDVIVNVNPLIIYQFG